MSVHFHCLHCLYLLAIVPFITDWFEYGHLPDTPRAWITEIVVSVLILILARVLRKDHAAIQKLVRIDKLTGLFNRHAFDERLVFEIARCKRYNDTLCMVMIDLDHFKDVNDTHGHAHGDKILAQFGKAILDTIRTHSDSGFRLGGDEFVLLLPSTNVSQGENLADHILAYCKELDTIWSTSTLGMSAGVVELIPDESVDYFLKRADVAMYTNKRLRR